MSDEENGNQPKVTFAPGKQAGSYTDFISVGFNGEIYVMTMCQIIPEGGTMVAHGRYILTPDHLARLSKVLQDKVAEYEQTHGPVRQVETPKPPTGGAVN